MIRSSGDRKQRGQSVVEFAFTLPIMVLLLLAIVDFARIYTTIIAVESGAREAADYGAFGSQRWQPAKLGETLAEMERRACTASMDLPDYVGDPAGTSCTNPTFAYELIPDPPDGNGPCDNATREPPCRVKVTLTHEFGVIAPFRLELMGTEYGIPSTLTFSQESVFAITDIQIPDE